MNEKNEGLIADTSAATTETEKGKETEKGEGKTFTQEQVNNLIKERLDRVYKRYGVENKEALDELVNKSLSYDLMNENYESLNQKITDLTQGNTDLQGKYDELNNNHRELTKKYALFSRNVKPELYNDIEMYFKGKGLDINEETLNEELKTHENWCNSGTVQPLGNEFSGQSQVSEKELAGKLLGVEL